MLEMVKNTSGRWSWAILATAIILSGCGGTTEPAEDGTNVTGDASGNESSASGASGATNKASGEAVGTATESVGSSQAEVLSSLTVGVHSPNYATQASIYVAEALGYFDEVGIEDVEVLTTQDAFVEALVSDSVDIVQGDTANLLSAAERSSEPIRLVAGFRDKEQRMIGVAEGIESVQDLAGQSVSAGDSGGRSEFILRQVLSELGIDPDEVEFQPFGGGSDARLQALIAGQLAGATLYVRHIEPLEAAGGSILYNEYVPVPQEFTAVMESFLEDERATVVAYLTATIRAKQYIADYEETKSNVVEIMTENGFEITDDFLAQYGATLKELSPDGGFDPDGLTSLVESSQAVDLMPSGLKWEDYVVMEPLWEAQEAAGVDLRPEPSS